jgi:hypothetical protein
LNTAVREYRTVLLPNSVITKLPSPIVGDVGKMSLRTRNSRPLVSPTATLWSLGRGTRLLTAHGSGASGSNA